MWLLTLWSFLQRPVEGPAAGVKQQDLRSFKLILEYIKALPVSYFMCLYVIHFYGIIWLSFYFSFFSIILDDSQTLDHNEL